MGPCFLRLAAILFVQGMVLMAVLSGLILDIKQPTNSGGVRGLYCAHNVVYTCSVQNIVNTI